MVRSLQDVIPEVCCQRLTLYLLCAGRAFEFMGEVGRFYRSHQRAVTPVDDEADIGPDVGPQWYVHVRAWASCTRSTKLWQRWERTTTLQVSTTHSEDA